MLHYIAYIVLASIRPSRVFTVVHPVVHPIRTCKSRRKGCRKFRFGGNIPCCTCDL